MTDLDAKEASPRRLRSHPTWAARARVSFLYPLPMPSKRKAAPAGAKSVGSPASGLILKVTLRGVKPPIWRRLRVSRELTLRDLHHVLQVSLGWTDSHLHQFVIGDVRYGLPDPEEDFGESPLDERKFRVGDLLPDGGRAQYEYDFGDGWEHSIVVERITSLPDGGNNKAECLAGARSCPPEDCGGPHGYADLLEALANPADRRHAELREWAGPHFDPGGFDLDAINQGLRGAGSAAWRKEREQFYP